MFLRSGCLGIPANPFPIKLYRENAENDHTTVYGNHKKSNCISGPGVVIFAEFNLYPSVTSAKEKRPGTIQKVKSTWNKY
jgi:hypothetical protein